MNVRSRIFFPGLNILRFYAAVAVIAEHVATSSNIRGLSHFPNLFEPLTYLFPAGREAVTLFFVISGFLITYLLLAEQEQTGTVSVRKFYIRRMLRIWPIYYLVVILGFFVMPIVFGSHNVISPRGYVFTLSDPDFWPKLGLFMFMLPNVVFALAADFIPAPHLWSIGVEEQFYLIWPLLMKAFRKRIGRVIYAIILAKVVATWAFLYLLKLPGDRNDVLLRLISAFLHDWRLDSIAVGAFCAYMLFLNRTWFLRIVFHPVVKYGSAAIFIWHILFFDTYSPGYLLLLSMLYALVLMNIAANPKPLFRFENRVTGFLGNLSYGIYVYHYLILYALLQVFRLVGFSAEGDPLLFNIAIYGGTLLISIAAAALSYRFIETPFLRLKSRFALVRSGSTAAPAEALEAPADRTPIPSPVPPV